MKKIGIILLSLIVAVGVIGYFLLGSLDDVVQSTVEDVGKQLTGTEVSLDNVVLDLAKGSATLEGLKIDNPAGYESDYAFLLKRITVSVNPASLTKPVIQLNEVIVRGARLNVEQRGERNNLSDLLAQVEANTKSDSDSQGQEPTPSAESDVRLTLKRFVFANTKATVVGSAKGGKAITVPDVKRSNIGNPKEGLTPEQLGDALLQAVLEDVETAVTNHLAGLAKQALTDKIKEKVGFPVKDEN
ncbi:MAG: hypothetical protein V7720_04705 [Halioglobus sp.]